MNEDQPRPPVILGPNGKPARIPPNARCPQCGASADKRVSSCGFGTPHQICSRCAYAFEE